MMPVESCQFLRQWLINWRDISTMLQARQHLYVQPCQIHPSSPILSKHIVSRSHFAAQLLLSVEKSWNSKQNKINTRPPVLIQSEPETTQTEKNTIDVQLFGASSATKHTLQLEMLQCFSEPKEEPGTNLLECWKRRAKVFSILSAISQYFLAIPLTSTPSGRIFSWGWNIISYQHSSLNPQATQMLLCLKEWYCTLGPLFQSSTQWVPTHSSSKESGHMYSMIQQCSMAL